MTGDLNGAIGSLEALPVDSLCHADDDTVHRFHQLVLRWTQRSAKETRQRANNRRRRRCELARNASMRR
jgi:hypothetical protein